jgi:glycosyltransferase involved in cell wall biosynthesis
MVNVRGSLRKIPTVTAVVIPAHNEADNIGRVLAAVAGSVVTEVIVVADACADETAAVASSARVIEIDAQDKGSAMAAGLAAVVDPLTLFLDADLIGLTARHVNALATLEPAGGMVVGLRSSTPPLGLPPISGERRLPTEFARTLGLAGVGYRAELLIDGAVARAGIGHRHYFMRGVTNPSRGLRHPLMWADLAATFALNLPSMALYTEQSVRAG